MVGVEALTFGYRRDQPILAGLDWDFGSGSVTAVTGRSGTGKSTLLYLLGLLLTPWSGKVMVGEKVASGLSDRLRSELRAERIGFVFQDAVLDPSRTVLDNVVEGALYTGLRRRKALRRATELMDRFGVGLRADHKPGEVSGGQAQRVALCRALLNNPHVLLADEPTGNLDQETARLVIDALSEHAHGEGGTVIIASHDPQVVAACDRVLAL
jgi:lipoprotein-releasing system ATP-binding protein